jgi:glutamate racemase
MAKWFIERIKLPLKYRWSIARGSSDFRENLIITFRDGDFSGMGEVAFLTGTGVTLEQIEKEFESFCSLVPDAINGLEDMMEILESDELDIHTNLRFGIESAYVHFVSKILGGSVSHVLGIEKVTKLKTCFSLPILPVSDYKAFIDEHDLTRFHSLKMKVNANDSTEAVDSILKYYDGQLWLDANESFKTANEVKLFCDKLDMARIDIMEQPLPSDLYDEQKKLKLLSLDCDLIADESLGNGAIYEEVAELYDGVNIKLMKAGGYFSALRQIRQAKRFGLKVMLGCMLETSLGISSALNIAHDLDYIDLDSFMFLETDPFSLVFEEFGVIQGDINQ